MLKYLFGLDCLKIKIKIIEQIRSELDVFKNHILDKITKNQDFSLNFTHCNQLHPANY